ncbi:hypothetical protein SAMN05192583_1241 [Sphingomonas gellani]|uniref:5-bromo-4-chloroindolyl phosphate hydrolysis protein n=1 Tax=Sphingomonas gellani TaxID=1166340 RepID=A0A1H8B7W0_9SPHN|nr:hypothetical protein [Sphingomonas gellani]SEM78922.1 hypothetical protein SAMN05192583_1241 [Sphingomonas gellani]
MASEVDQQIERARQAMARIADSRDGGGTPIARGRSRKSGTAAKRLKAIVIAAAAILLGAVAWGLVMPIGIFGALLVLVLLVVATVAIAAAPGPRPVSTEKLREADLKVLPAQTGRWLESQRSTLPIAARSVADSIGARLDALAPQLGRVDSDGEEALEIRRLIGEQLPAFVADYGRVPAALRTVDRNGRTPDSELVAGLSLIEREIADMTQRLAQPDLDTLQTRGRYLQMKYQDEAEG